MRDSRYNRYNSYCLLYALGPGSFCLMYEFHPDWMCGVHPQVALGFPTTGAVEEKK